MRYLAIDPSLTCTGYAVLDDDGSDAGKLVSAGKIKPRAGSLTDRALEMGNDIYAECERWSPTVIVVELPFAKKRGGPKSVRSTMTLPNYGIAVGVALANADRWATEQTGRQNYDVVTTPADDWSRGLPSCRGDDSKGNRVKSACFYYGREPESFGCVTDAGNVADAVLMARWAMLKRRIR